MAAQWRGIRCVDGQQYKGPIRKNVYKGDGDDDDGILVSVLVS